MVKTARNRGMDFRYLDSSLFVNKDRVSVHRRNNTSLDYISMKDLILSALKRKFLCNDWSGDMVSEDFDILIPRSAFVTRPQRNGLNRNIDLYAIINTLGEASSLCNNNSFTTPFGYTLDFVNDLHLSLKVDPTNNNRFFVDTGIVDTETVSLLSIIEKFANTVAIDYTPTTSLEIDYTDPDAVTVQFELLDINGDAISADDSSITLFLEGSDFGPYDMGDSFSINDTLFIEGIFKMEGLTGTVDSFVFSKNPSEFVSHRSPIAVWYEYTYNAPNGATISGSTPIKDVPILAGGTR